MKKAVVILFCVVITQLITSCYKTDDGAYTDPNYHLREDGWNLNITSVTQFDLIAVAAGTKPEKVVLTNKFNFKTFTIKFNVDENFAPTTFEVGGTSPELFLKTGFWKLNNAFPNTDGTALVIELYSDEAKTQLVDGLNITAVPGAKATLQFDLIRKTNGVSFVDYQYLLKLAK